MYTVSSVAVIRAEVGVGTRQKLEWLRRVPLELVLFLKSVYIIINE